MKEVVEEICKSCTLHRVGDNRTKGDAKTSTKIYSEILTLEDIFFQKKINRC